jgi:protein Mpv17
LTHFHSKDKRKTDQIATTAIMTLLHHHRLLVLSITVWVVVVVYSEEAASAFQGRAAAVVGPRQRILAPSIKKPNSNFIRSKDIKNHNNAGALLHRGGLIDSKLSSPTFLTKLEASVAFDDESYFAAPRGGAGISNQRQQLEQRIVAVASSRMIRWPILVAFLLLAMRQAHPIVVPLLKSLVHSYDQSMLARPLITKVITGAVLATLGDALAQSKTVAKSSSTTTTTTESSSTASATVVRYDPRRAASFAAFDACYRCFQHYAFPTVIRTCRGNFLGRFVSMFSSSSATTLGAETLHLLAVAERTLMYQLAVVPLLYYPVFFLFTGFMQGLNLSQTLERSKKNFIPCWKRNLLFWIPVQTLMFGWIHEQWAFYGARFSA